MSEIVYDVTRLVSRFLNATPNGIDRVDVTLARHFLGDRAREASGAVFIPGLGHFHLPRIGALDLLDRLDRHFGERAVSTPKPSLRRIADWLRDGRVGEGASLGPVGIRSERRAAPGAALRLALRHGATLLRSARRSLPPAARYINVSQYPLAREGALDWLGARRDIKPIFFVHDLLPLETPEYFREREFGRHQTRLRQVARLAAGVIVSTRVVKQALAAHLARLGRRDLPIAIAPPPVSPLFLAGGRVAPELRATPYFLQCGTIEPRKNHLTMLHVWRELVARHGTAAPKLVIVGARGWENENIVDLLERCAALSRPCARSLGARYAKSRAIDAERARAADAFVRRGLWLAGARGARARHARDRLRHSRLSRGRGGAFHRDLADRRSRMAASDRNRCPSDPLRRRWPGGRTRSSRANSFAQSRRSSTRFEGTVRGAKRRLDCFPSLAMRTKRRTFYFTVAAVAATPAREPPVDRPPLTTAITFETSVNGAFET